MTWNVSLTVRHGLWRSDQERGRDERTHWVDRLATHSGLEPSFCRGLLSDRIADEAITASQLEAIAVALDLPDHGASLRFEDPLARTNVLTANLNFLFGRLGHGGKKSMATTLGVKQTTISRWLAGTSQPESPTLQRIVKAFRLPAGTNLRTEPLFLALDPVSLVDKRSWVRDRLDNMSEDELQDLYPALRRMLEEDR